MIRIFARTAEAVIVLAATAMLYFWCIEPMSCDVRLAAIRRRIVAADSDADNDRAVIRARQILADVRTCRAAYDQALEVMMTEANCDQILQRYDDAARIYKKALERDRRPELYLNLGLMLIQLGDDAHGRDCIAAAAFFNPYVLGDIEDPQLRQIVQAAVSNYQLSGKPIYERVMRALRNGDGL